MTTASSYFRLKSLKIKNYKNIKDFDIDFSNKDGVTVLIGNNGCGKSNIIEAMSSIFAGLYQKKLHTPDFFYAIKYEINGSIVDLSWDKSSYKVKIDNVSSNLDKLSQDYLPKNVIACYSGENKRLWETYYEPYYKKYISSVKKSESMPNLPMIYINRYNIEISLITLFFYDFNTFEDIKIFCHSTLKIKKVTEIIFTFDTSKISKWKENSVLQMVKKISEVEQISDLPKNISISLDSLKNRLSYMNEKELFKTLYAATMPKKYKIITDIVLKIELNNGDQIVASDLSEGENKLLLMTTILESVADENSLLLFDEPDAHIHICRKAELKNCFEKYVNRESIITTHSPTLAVKFEERHIEGICLDENGYTSKIDGQKAKLVAELTNKMWNIQEQNLFLASNKPVILLVEGKTDKIHIEEAFKRLKSSYSELDFDVFAMNGSEHIREVLIGLNSSDICWNKKFIGLFDNDKAGQNDIKNGFEKDNANCVIKHVRYGDRAPSNSFFAFLLPNSATSIKDFTIENCYDDRKYEEAYKMAVEKKSGHFGQLSIDKIADDLKNDSKIILAENAKNFRNDDFEKFKEIFNIVKEIADL